ncbi:hypothetical protein ORV05_08215 [Amycolatopsis cynarae]|uniref:Uncharacterized protein n=1 Tax=Amycolatopsis cynarae TaxID=2995223 RepID=A0ABY7B6G6_9PSEU|nr:hypothetical protein [Amycolatopsis sp. HUAS 11-8]WAL67746.1 hypothetical protein ORV05_08215 [Amycolatopsis sp. HUAS 11-8]
MARLPSRVCRGGVKVTNTLDAAGTPVSRTYSRTSDGALVAASSMIETLVSIPPDLHPER